MKRIQEAHRLEALNHLGTSWEPEQDLTNIRKVKYFQWAPIFEPLTRVKMWWVKTTQNPNLNESTISAVNFLTGKYPCTDCSDSFWNGPFSNNRFKIPKRKNCCRNCHLHFGKHKRPLLKSAEKQQSSYMAVEASAATQRSDSSAQVHGEGTRLALSFSDSSTHNSPWDEHQG